MTALILQATPFVEMARCVRTVIEARRRRAEHEEEFRRSFEAYCRARNLPAVCEDDWSTGLRSPARCAFTDRRLIYPTSNLEKETCHGQG